MLYVALLTPAGRIDGSRPGADTRPTMTSHELTQVGMFLAGYVLFLWLLTWPLRHATWLQRMRFEAHRRQTLRWLDQHGGR